MPVPSTGRRSASLRSASRWSLLPVAAACLPIWASAQVISPTPSGFGEVTAPGGGLGGTAGSAGGAAGGGTGGDAQRHGLVVTPVASVQETFSDNVALSNTDKHSDFATQATVGVRATSNSGRVRGSVDYSLTGIAHSSQAGGDQFVNALNAYVTGELITNHLYVDVTGNISQQALSAFGTQSVDATSSNSNRTEVSTFGISPYLRGLITPAVAYEARVNGAWTSASSNTTAASSQYSGLLHFGSAERGLFGWTADATTSTVRYTQGGSLSSDSDSYKGSAIFNPNPDVSLSLIGGAEKNNYLSTEKKTYSDAGGQVRWQPSPRTTFTGRYEHRYFGNSHNVEFAYRTARSSWNFTDVRDVTTSRTPTGGVFQVINPLFQALYQLAFIDIASQVPDPVERDRVIRDSLARAGISQTLTVSNLFLTSQVTLQRTQALTFTLLGIRDTVVFRLAKTSSSGLGNTPIFGNGLSSSTSVRQTGGTVDLTHRLTSITSVGTSLQYLRSNGDQADQTTTLKAVYLNLNTRVGPRSNLGGGVRHVIFDSTTTPYTENAVYATYSQSF